MKHINEFVEYCSRRIKYLETVIAEKEKHLKETPDGYLRCRHKGNKTYYYAAQGTSNGTYIPKSKMGLAMSLAQKGYNKKVLKTAQKELAILRILKRHFEKYGIPENVINTYAHRNMVHPIQMSDEEYIAWWKREHAPSNKRPPDPSNPNYPFRSRVEMAIALKLEQCGVIYSYESKLVIDGEVFYPDFAILKLKTRETYYWEHCGLMDDMNYVRKLIHKLKMFARIGIETGKNLILTFETGTDQFHMSRIDKIIEELLR